MARMAKVGSIQELLEFRAALVQFIQAASNSLDESLGEVRRMEHWLKTEQAVYWKKKEMFLTEKVSQLRQDLNRKQQLDQVGPVQSRKSYVDEKRALQRAKLLLEEAQEKQKQVKRWSLKVERDGSVYHGMLNDLRDMLENRLPTARGQLDQMVRALEAYAQTADINEEATSTAMPVEEEELQSGGDAGTETSGSQEPPAGE